MSSQHLRSRGTGRRVFGSWVLSVTFTTVFCVTHSSSRLCAQDARELQKAKKETREKLFEKMRTRAETTKVYSLADNKRTEAKLVPQPIFRYSDQPRFIVDATMWVWGTKGRPIAMCKVERYRQPNREWLYCMASLSPGLIEIQWQSGRRWTALFVAKPT